MMARRGKQKSRVDRKKDGEGGKQRNGKDDNLGVIKNGGFLKPFLPD